MASSAEVKNDCLEPPIKKAIIEGENEDESDKNEGKEQLAVDDFVGRGNNDVAQVEAALAAREGFSSENFKVILGYTQRIVIFNKAIITWFLINRLKSEICPSSWASVSSRNYSRRRDCCFISSRILAIEAMSLSTSGKGLAWWPSFWNIGFCMKSYYEAYNVNKMGYTYILLVFIT